MPNLIKKIRTNAGDLQIDYNALANLPTISNPNLLINSDFRNPVNQRGQTTYTEGTERYGVDRWLLYNSTREVVNSGSITVTNVGEATTWFAQKFERPLDNSESYAITVKVGAITGNGAYVSIGNQDEATTPGILQTGINKFIVDTNEITSAMEQFIVTLPVGTSVELIYIKLEQGSTVTPFVPKAYAQEVAECQRYFTKSNGYRLNVVHGTNDLYMTIPLAATLRHVPTISIGVGTVCVALHDSGVASRYTIKSYRVDSVTNNHIVIDLIGEYGVGVYKTGISVEDLPIFIDAEIY